MKRFITVIAAFLILVTATAYSAVITGTVVNGRDNSTIDGATITVEEGGRLLTTNLDGKFTIASGGNDVHISVTHVGFQAQKGILISSGSDNKISLMPAVSELNPIVVTAKRFEKESFQVAQPVTAYNAKQIQTKGQTTITEIVHNAPGVDVNDAGPFRARPVIRGLSGTRILVLVDGERLNDQRDVVDFAGVSMSLVDVNEVDRVEVLNGPSSVLYGSDAMGGVINILTRQNSFSPVLQPFVSYSSRYSSADQHSSNRVNFGVQAERYAISAGFMYRETNRDYSPGDNWQTKDPRYNVFRQSFYDSLNTARGTSWSTENLVNSTARVNNYDFGLAFKLNEKSRLDFDFGAFRGSDIGFAGVPNDSTPFYFYWPNHDRDNFSVAYSGRGFGGKLAKVDARLYYQKISKDFLTDFLDAIVIPAGPPPNPPTITPLTSLSNTEVQKFGLNLQSLYQVSPHATLTFGADSWLEEIKGSVTSISHFEGFGPFPFDDTSHSASVPENQWFSVGIFASSEIEVNKVSITAGARFDNFWLNTDVTDGYVDENDNPLPAADDSYNSLNGSLGLVVPISEVMNAVANIGTAYRVPNVVERFFYGSSEGNNVRPNPDIEPEKSFTVDLGFKAAREYVNYSLMGFYSDYTNFTQLRMFGTDPITSQPLWRYENIDDVTIYGIEGVVEGRLDNGFYGGFGLGYQHGENDTEKQPVFVSPLKTRVTAGYRDPRDVYFGELNILRAEKQNRIPIITNLDDIATEGFTVVNAMVGARVWERLILSLNVNNIFDEVYSQPFNGRNADNPVPELGRNFILSAKVDVNM